MRGKDNCAGRDYTVEEMQFILAVDHWRLLTGRRFPSASEYLALAKALGYRQVEAMGPLPKKRSIIQ